MTRSIVALSLAAGLCGVSVAPANADRGGGFHGGGFHGGFFHGGFHNGFHGGCCFRGGFWWPGVAFGLGLGAIAAAPYYYAPPYYPPVYYSPPQTYYQPPPSRLHLSYSNRHADMLFQLVSRRYQNKSTLITTNRAFGEWNEVSSRISQTASACSAVQVTGISIVIGRR